MVKEEENLDKDYKIGDQIVVEDSNTSDLILTVVKRPTAHR